MIVTDWAPYAPYFSEAEFACRETGECLMDKRFITTLLHIRKAYGKPMSITSGYRSPQHSKERNKAAPGEHTFGCAADVAVSGADAIELLKIALDNGITRVGVKQDNRGTEYLHLGIGAPGLPPFALWSY